MKTPRLLFKFTAVAVYAVAMAYLESAVVVYLRRIYNIADPLQGTPLDSYIGAIEIGREAATLVMLAAIGWIAGHKLASRLGYAAIAFGVWDIFYYAWLKVFTGWPGSLLDPDILFLIPLPWWGPVLAPVLISLAMIAGGAVAAARESQGLPVRPGLASWAALLAGVLVMLYAFMADAIQTLPAPAEVLNQIRPVTFHWLLFLAGLALAMVFVISLAAGRRTVKAGAVQPALEKNP